MPESLVIYFGKSMKVNCDGNCAKAWGINSRPKIVLCEDNVDDYAFLADHELDTAPTDPGTYEGGDGKPESLSEFPNKWCIRECERCNRSSPGRFMEPLDINSFDDRVYNIPDRQPS